MKNNNEELLSLSRLTFSLPAPIIDLGERFEKAGYELALVGGAVRDLLLHRPLHDYDFATSATPKQMEPILRMWGNGGFWDIGRKFGTLSAQYIDYKKSFSSTAHNPHDSHDSQLTLSSISADKSEKSLEEKTYEYTVEVTTYRSDKYEHDSRKPQIQYGTSLEGDLSRRDFTINAMAIRLPSGEFVDPFYGRKDLERRLLRTPVDPYQSFDDDPLRMMRAIRFSAQLNCEIEISTASALLDTVERIKIISIERIHDELVKLMLSQNPRRGIEDLVNSGLADIIIPEIPALKIPINEKYHHKDIYEHSLTVLDNAIKLETDENGPVPAPDLELRLAALLHDIGKPATRKFESGGKVSFYHHDIVGAKMARKRLKALRFDHKVVERVSKLVELHLRFHGYVDERWSDSAVRRYVADAGSLYTRLNRLTRADSTTQNKQKARIFKEAMDELEERVELLEEQENLDKIRPELNGVEIMEILNLKPGRQVGEAYQHMLAYRLDNGEVGKEKAREELLSWWEKNQ